MCRVLHRYFYVVNGDGSLTRDEVETSKGQLVAAHNGWVMNADPLKNFALEDSQVCVPGYKELLL